jgi:ubiquitin carboxyl-terminal hydrolase 10
VYPLPDAPIEETAEAPSEQTTPKTQADKEPNVIGEIETQRVEPSTPTPLASDAPSEDMSTQPTTPASSAAAAVSIKSQQTPTQSRSKPAGQVVPVIPALPQSPTAPRRAHRDSTISTPAASEVASPAEVADATVPTVAVDQQPVDSDVDAAPVPIAPKPKPSSWASLLRPTQSQSQSIGSADATSNTSGVPTARGETLSDVLNDMNISVDAPSKVSFLQPRGLVNTGNMCYMNSVSLAFHCLVLC